MDNYKKVLEHALRISYYDEIREFEQLNNLPLNKKIYIWLYKFLKISIKTIFFLINSIFNKDSKLNFVYEKYQWILVNDHSGHCEYFIDGIIKKFSKRESILYISINENLKLNYPNVDKKINKFQYFTIASLIASLKFSFQKKEIFNTLGIWKLPVFFSYVFANARAIQTIKFYQNIKLNKKSKLITLCDAHWHQSVLTSEFNNRNLTTFTLIHGQPSEWYLLCPFISNYVLTWGPSMTRMVLKNCKDIKKERIIEIGNTKFTDDPIKLEFDDYSIEEIEEIIFISPGFDSFEIYGQRGLKEEILKFCNLNLPNYKLSIRPRPFNSEVEFIRKLISDNNFSDSVAIYSEGEFVDLVNKKRIFIGSISSAISDVLSLNGLFIGLHEEIPEDILETMITYSRDIYFSMNKLEKFLNSLKDKVVFDNYISVMNEIRNELVSPVPERIDLYLESIISS